jgi:hypothetical protein
VLADVKGSMDLAEQVIEDCTRSEPLPEIHRRRAPVRGTVNRTGDGIMAQRADHPEDHAPHLLRGAAFAKGCSSTEELAHARLNFAARMGSLGRVVVGKIGDDRGGSRPKGTRWLARMEQLADPGKT